MESRNTVNESSDEPVAKPSQNVSGDGEKKLGGYTSSTRWGQETLSTEDCGQKPDKLRSPGERELSGYDDNTTTVGQPGDRKNLTRIDSNKFRSLSRDEQTDRLIALP